MNTEPPWEVTPLISELQIHLRTAQIAEQIVRDCQVREMAVVVVLKGAFVFAADLLRRLAEQGMSLEVDFLRAASYGENDRSAGKVSLQLDVSIDLVGKQVLLIDDICDTGLTLTNLVAHLKRKGTTNIKTCVLLDKPDRRQAVFNPDYSGFIIPDRFVVGYGLDYAEQFRCLPYIASIEPRKS